MVRLMKETDQGKFTVGKIYDFERITGKGHPIVIDDSGKEIDIWVSKDNSGYIPECWEQVDKLSEIEAKSLGLI